MEDEDIQAYNNYIKEFNPKGIFGKVEIYTAIIKTLEDFDFLELKLGIYTHEFILKLKENIETYENRVLEDIENNNYPDLKKRAILQTKKKAEGLILSLVNELKEVEPATDPPKEEKTIHDFFINTSFEKIQKLQNKFNGYKGKNLAILIHILNNEYNVLFIDDNNRKGGSRSFFIKQFMNNNSYDTSGVGNYFEGSTGKFKVGTSDPTYISIEILVSDIINKPD